MAAKRLDAAEVRPFTRNAAEVAELRRFCQLWRDGAERFWSFDDVLAALSRSGSVAYYATADLLAGSTDTGAAWQGVILADVGPFTADLLYVYVAKEHRGAGVARHLVERLTEELAARPQIEALLLEVRASNQPAQRLYESFGMVQVDRRKSYYSDGEDALVYRLEMQRP